MRKMIAIAAISENMPPMEEQADALDALAAEWIFRPLRMADTEARRRIALRIKIEQQDAPACCRECSGSNEVIELHEWLLQALG